MINLRLYKNFSVMVWIGNHINGLRKKCICFKSNVHDNFNQVTRNTSRSIESNLVHKIILYLYLINKKSGYAF